MAAFRRARKDAPVIGAAYALHALPRFLRRWRFEPALEYFGPRADGGHVLVIERAFLA